MPIETAASHSPSPTANKRSVPRAFFVAAIASVVATAAGVSFLPTARPTLASIAVFAEEGVVHTIDGRTFEGQITESGDEVIIDRNGIVTRLQRSDVTGIEYGTAPERLRKRLAALEAGDIAGRLEIGRDALSRKLFDVAEEAAVSIETIDPENQAAARLRMEIARRQRAEQQRGNAAPEAGPATRRNRGPQPPDKASLLSEDEINRIRLAELQPRDAESPPTIRFDNRVLQRFVESRPDLEFADFNRSNDVEKTLDILENGTPEMRDDIRILTDPGSLLQFKRQIHTALIESCATSACHGGENAGRFVLYPNPKTDEVIYTNFYTLTRADAEFPDPAAGAFGGEGNLVRRMIDRDVPDQSLLLRFMLPPRDVEWGHPEVNGFRPRFPNSNEPQFLVLRDWIINTLERAEEDYGIDFVPPGQPSVTTRPALDNENGPATLPADDGAAGGPGGQ